MSGALPNLPGRRFAVTITDLRSSLAGAGASGSSLCFPALGIARRFVTIAGTSNRMARTHETPGFDR
jgi:hypothetical protein